MRKLLLCAAAASLCVCAVAYAAGPQTTYFVGKSTKVTPVKSGTRQHPVAVGFHLVYGATTTPAGKRPAVVKRYKISGQGLRENSNDFKACGTSRVLQQGPSSCPRKSRIGSGYFIAAVAQSGSTTIAFTCRAEVTVFNGGNHHLTLFIFQGHPIAGQPMPCPLQSPNGFAINAKIVHRGDNEIETFTVPAALRHVTLGTATFDVALEKAVVNIPVTKTTVIRHVHGKRVRRRVGMFESTSCPANHERQIAVTFTPERGAPATATREVKCT